MTSKKGERGIGKRIQWGKKSGKYHNREDSEKVGDGPRLGDWEKKGRAKDNGGRFPRKQGKSKGGKR